MKADLHVHSKYSTRPSQWILQKIGCPESFTEPRKIYDLAMQRGMDLVTITDHNTIDGALEIAHLPNTFISEEVTTYFPEDGCKIHVLAFDVNEEQHKDIQKARPSIYDLVHYLHTEEIVHALAHPLYSTNDRLTVQHFEQLLLLFKTLELNGARDEVHNDVLKWIVSNLKPSDIDFLAEKHGISPLFADPSRKNLIAGSDDHSSLCIAHKFTEIGGVSDTQQFLDAIETCGYKGFGNASTPLTMARNIYSIAYQFYKAKFSLEKDIQRDIFFLFLERSLNGNDQQTSVISKLYFLWKHHKRPRNSKQTHTLQSLLKDESQKLIWNDPGLMHIVNGGNGKKDQLDKKWFEFVNHVSNKVMLHFSDHFLEHLFGANFLDLFTSLGSASALYSIFAPYFVAFSLFAKDQEVTQRIAQRFGLDLPFLEEKTPDPSVAHFTDTFSEINGVALTLKQQVEIAKSTGKDLTIITCADGSPEGIPGVTYFAPIGVHALPEYPELKLYSPPFLDMLNYCFEKQFTHIHSATPGPVGLAALAISRILRLPINGTYHTSLPQYAGYLTEDSSIEDLTWRYVLWYYNQMDYVYVSSRASGKELLDKGIKEDKLRLFPRGIDIQRFHPSKRDMEFIRQYGGPAKKRLLYVGRVSREKNLPLLVQVFKNLLQYMNNVSLIVVGDGPYLKSMKEELAGTPAYFTGYLKGEALEKIYASTDLLVFPSTIDTFGNVVLEAQASGLPVVVADSGGPKENMIHGKTGLVVPSDDCQAMVAAIQSLLNDSLRLKAMAKAGRKYMEDRSFEGAFNETWEMYNLQSRDHASPAQMLGEAS